MTVGRGSSPCTCCHFLKRVRLCRATSTQPHHLFMPFIHCEWTNYKYHPHCGRWTCSFNRLWGLVYELKAREHVCRSPHCRRDLLITAAMFSRLMLEKIINAHLNFFQNNVDLLFFHKGELILLSRLHFAWNMSALSVREPTEISRMAYPEH